VGATRVASKFGGLNITEWLPFDCAQGGELVEPQPRKESHTEVAIVWMLLVADPLHYRGRPMSYGKKWECAP
jgi:hypothetical protein